MLFLNNRILRGRWGALGVALVSLLLFAPAGAQSGPGAQFTNPVPGPLGGRDNRGCVTAFFRQESSTQEWKLFLRDDAPATVELTLVTVPVGGLQHGTLAARVRDEVGEKVVRIPHDSANEQSQNLSLQLAPRKVYALTLERTEPLTPPPLHHYRLFSRDPRLELGWERPLQSLPPITSWGINSEVDEALRIELFTDSPAPFNAPQATQGAYRILRPDGRVFEGERMIERIPTVLEVPVLGPHQILDFHMNGLFRMRKLSGADRGFYAVPCTDQSALFPLIGPFGPAFPAQPAGQTGGLPLLPITLGVLGGALAAGLTFVLLARRRARVAAVTLTVQQGPTLGGPRQASLEEGAEAPELGPPNGKRLPVGELGGLTAREVEVVRLVARGQSNKEIAQGLSISEATVKRHIENTLRKLKLEGRTQIATWALQNGLGS